jgi:glucuronate isomerase
MSRFTPKVVTANRLREGDVVYLTTDDRWSPLHHHAELIEDEAHAQKLVVVGAYLADAKMGSKGPEPTHFREAFRTRGPSNYAHGKQADLPNV